MPSVHWHHRRGAGIGPTRALQLIQKHGSIEEILKNLDKAKYPGASPASRLLVFSLGYSGGLLAEFSVAVEADWPFEEARKLFLHPEVTPPDEIDLKWNDPDEEGLVEFLCKQNGFQCALGGVPIGLRGGG